MLSLVALAAAGQMFTRVHSPEAAGGPYPGIKTVHVINSCHLDIGFLNTSASIVNLYFEQHLPKAAAVGAELARGVPGYTDTRLGFMFQSWILDLFFSCPPHLGVRCPNETTIAAVTQAIKAGHITWHAFPFNAQLAAMDPSLIEAGLELTYALDRRFGQPNKTVLSQRDVPGMTRSVLLGLARKGVAAVSIGANDGSTPPTLPPCFVWDDPLSKTQLLGLMTWPGYGSIEEGTHCVVDGLEHALVYNWNGDNAGPSDASVYASQWRALRTTFPNADIRASSLDSFAAALAPHASSLPRVSQEAGDTWEYGIPSDPQRTARMRVFNRAWGNLAAQEGGSIAPALARDPHLRNATRFAMLLGEHTWGRDTKKVLDDWTNWENADFERARAPGARDASRFAATEASSTPSS